VKFGCSKDAYVDSILSFSMAPKANTKKGRQNDHAGPAGLQAGTKSQYEERQQDEVTVLKSIYGDDFVEHKAHGAAWKKTEPAFDIQIKSNSDEDVTATLGVIMTATYPRSIPLLSLKNTDHLKESTLFKIQKFVETKPRELAAQDAEMIDILVEGIREILDDAAQARAAGLELPSLEEERAAHEALLAKQAKDMREKENEKKLAETREEERTLGALVEKERERQRTRAKETRKNRRPNRSPERDAEEPTGADYMSLDEPCAMTDSSGNTVYFRTIKGKTLLRAGPLSSVYLVLPILYESDGMQRPLTLKQTELHSSSKDAVQDLKQVQALEALLKSLKDLKRKPHKNILEVLDFRIDRTMSGADTVWTVGVVSLHAENGSLEDCLSLIGKLDVTKAKAWTRDLLDALTYLHNHGILHQDICPSNVLFVREGRGDVVIKLADAGYQMELYNICIKTRTLKTMRAAKSAYWFPPEIAGASRPQYSRKTDVWDFGVMFLQMLFGLDVPQRFHSPKEFMEAHALSDSLHELVSSFFVADPKKRPQPFDLGSSEFLATDAPVLTEDTSAIAGSTISLPQTLGPRLRRESTNNVTRPAMSRYREDFVEEGRLGKGGFGEVVKARKKLDGQIYAIKKITIMQGSQSLTVTDILKEVRLLSQLNHPAVVRYYNAWLEEIPEFADTDTEGAQSIDNGNDVEFSDEDVNIEFTKSGGLDFISSGGYPAIEFGYDDSEEEESEDEDEEEDSGSETESVLQSNGEHVLRERTRRGSTRPFRTIMYISMEYCEKRVSLISWTKRLSLYRH